MSLEIRSYRAVFDLERRIYRIDRLRLNPGGVPVRGIVYCLALLALVALAGALPLAGIAVRTLPWWLRDLLLPVGGAALLSMIRVEGRPFHLAAAAVARHLCAPGRHAGISPGASLSAAGGRLSVAPGRLWRPEELLLLPDDAPGTRPRRLRYSGPGAVRVAAYRQVLVLERGAELRVGPVVRRVGAQQVRAERSGVRRATVAWRVGAR
ncbi:MAG TPA: hypothetical protein VNV42_10445 [Solirubrobacteraceae bacterium]|nr:hypothetical protein [Solirubrobacteraceae bacterium]